MKIKVCQENAEKIQEVLDKAQKGARERKAHSYQVFQARTKGEKLLDSKEVPQKYRKGFRIIYGETISCNSYNYIPRATFFTLERGSKDWFLVSAVRKDTAARRGASDMVITPSLEAGEWWKAKALEQLIYRGDL